MRLAFRALLAATLLPLAACSRPAEKTAATDTGAMAPGATTPAPAPAAAAPVASPTAAVVVLYNFPKDTAAFEKY